VSRFDGVSWQTFNVANSNLPDDYAIELAVDDENNVWVLSATGLSVIRKDDSTLYVGYPFVEDPLFLSVDIAPGGNVWIAGFSQTSIAEYDPVGNQWRVLDTLSEHVSFSSKESNQVVVWDIAVESPDHLWIAANSIVEVDGNTWQLHQPSDSPSSVFVDPRGNRWFGLNSGSLLLLSPDDQWWRYDYDDRTIGLNVDRIYDIAYDPRGGIWLITLSGATRFTPNK